MVVRNRIQYWRQQLGMTLVQFASMLETHPGTVSRWETSQQNPTMEMYVKLWLKLKERHPEVHLEDLIEPVSE